MTGVPHELSRLKVRVCRDADAAHRESLRAYGHTFCRPAPTICVSSAFFGLSPGHRDGVLAHEIGHLLAGPRAGEEDADRAFEAATGVRIQYRDGEHGRCLQWLPAPDRRRLVGLFEFDFGGTRQDYEEPESDDVRFFVETDGTRQELDTLREAETAAAEDPDADVWAQEGRRRLGWRPMARNPGKLPANGRRSGMFSEHYPESWAEYQRFKAALPGLMRDDSLRGRWVVFYAGMVQSVWLDQDSALNERRSAYNGIKGVIVSQVAEPEPVYMRYLP